MTIYIFYEPKDSGIYLIQVCCELSLAMKVDLFPSG